MRCFAFLFVIILSFAIPIEVFAKNWRTPTDWEILYWDVNRNVKSGVNGVVLVIGYKGRGNSGILEGIHVCGYDAKRDRTVCSKKINYGRVKKSTPAKMKVIIGATHYPIYKVFLREED